MATNKETIEVCRSFSQKVGHPKNRFENSDFFASAKREVPLEEFEKTSRELAELTRKEVEASVTAYKNEFDREVTYEPVLATPEEAEAVQRKIEAVQAELINNEDKAKLQEAENI